MQIPSLGQEDTLEKGKATHSSMGSQRVRHNWETNTLTSHFQRANIVQFHLYKIIRVVKFIETESRMVDAKGWGAWGNMEVMFNGYKGLLGEDKESSGDGSHWTIYLKMVKTVNLIYVYFTTLKNNFKTEKIHWTCQKFELASLKKLLKRQARDWGKMFTKYVCAIHTMGFPVAQMVKNLPAIQETWVRSLGWEDPLQKRMATHSSILAWKIPWTEEPRRLQSMGS